MSPRSSLIPFCAPSHQQQAPIPKSGSGDASQNAAAASAGSNGAALTVDPITQSPLERLRIASWQSQSHFDIIHRQGLRAPPLVFTYCIPTDRKVDHCCFPSAAFLIPLIHCWFCWLSAIIVSMLSESSLLFYLSSPNFCSANRTSSLLSPQIQRGQISLQFGPEQDDKSIESSLCCQNESSQCWKILLYSWLLWLMVSKWHACFSFLRLAPLSFSAFSSSQSGLCLSRLKSRSQPLQPNGQSMLKFSISI